MQAAVGRAVLGFIAAAIAVLTFHQGMWAALHYLDLPGLGMRAPYPVNGVPPWGVPLIVDLCFWGGLYGAVFGLLRPLFTWPLWLCGVITGLIAVLVGFFVVPALKGAAGRRRVGAGELDPPGPDQRFLGPRPGIDPAAVRARDATGLGLAAGTL